ncbi:MAG TPA: septum formation initiator family protein [Kiritimatiellia bacterium]|nr:septum formation initiator family protein [Kiritimatiellia bacterium]
MNFWVLIYRIGWFALAVLIVVALASLFVPQIKQYQEYHRKQTTLEADIALEKQMLKHLQEQQQRLKSDPRFVEKIAREEFGYAKPGETIFKFVEEEPQTRTPATGSR